MITLLLIRHGIAEDPKRGQRDSERALTAEGWARTRAAMQGLVARGFVPSRGYSSPYRRAAETLLCLKEAAPEGFRADYCEDLVPEGRPLDVEYWLRGLLAEAEVPATLALVSHQPLLSDLIHHLTGRFVDVKKASCTVLHWGERGFEFALHLTPSELRAGV
ncbi:SixA phosphatase family protein [Holophaga foetida]|uniref:SixA phosphatase family protein n=1 Tax=Holophaga foetida TaxID=35839 RepID=UPI0002473389|nr:histidine phosphatase family protein [Holophaga foetida]